MAEINMAMVRMQQHVVKYEVWEGSQHKAHVPYKEVH
jgi:hypothetical protein